MNPPRVKSLQSFCENTKGEMKSDMGTFGAVVGVASRGQLSRLVEDFQV